MNLQELETWDPESGALNIVIETAKGSRNKLKYNPQLGLIELSKVLPRGMVFPFDFGFVPSTLGDDGDPLDVLALLDEPVPAGCKVAARLVGVIEAEQTEDGKTERNDRLVAVSQGCHEHSHIRSLKDVNDHLIAEIEHFFVSYNEMQNRQFRVVERHGPSRAERLVREGIQKFRTKNKRAAAGSRNGKHKKSKR